jgi:hypothetical protein
MLMGTLAVASAAPARADGLSTPEVDRLVHGNSVVRPQNLDRGGRHYVGGVSYAIVDADPDVVARLFDSPDAWQRVLPHTRSAQYAGRNGDDRLIEVTHGNALIQVSYTMRVHRDARTARFHLEPGRPHDIEDAWGFLRAQPFGSGRTLLTYGLLLDIGPGMLRDLFEERVRATALTVPERIRGLIAESAAHGRQALR